MLDYRIDATAATTMLLMVKDIRELLNSLQMCGIEDRHSA